MWPIRVSVIVKMNLVRFQNGHWKIGIRSNKSTSDICLRNIVAVEFNAIAYTAECLVR